jgi:hypothetical protein
VYLYPQISRIKIMGLSHSNRIISIGSIEKKDLALGIFVSGKFLYTTSIKYSNS